MRQTSCLLARANASRCGLSFILNREGIRPIEKPHKGRRVGGTGELARGRTRMRSRRMTRRMGGTSICATHAPASEPCSLAGSAASAASAARQPKRVSNSLPPAPAAVRARTQQPHQQAKNERASKWWRPTGGATRLGVRIRPHRS